MKIRIYYHHTDSGGVVYYAKYLEFLEEARTQYLEERGILINKLSQEGINFVVAHHETDYKFPARYADLLDVQTHITEMSQVRLNFYAEIKNQSGQIICISKTVLVCVDSSFKPRQIPQELRSKLE